MAYPDRDFLPRPAGRSGRRGSGHRPARCGVGRDPEEPGHGRHGRASKPARRPPKPMPDLEFLDADDKPLRLANLTGQGAADQTCGRPGVAPCREGDAEPRPSAGRPCPGTSSSCCRSRSTDHPRPRVAPLLQEARPHQPRRLLRQGPQGDVGARRLAAADIDPGRSRRPRARPDRGRCRLGHTRGDRASCKPPIANKS